MQQEWEMKKTESIERRKYSANEVKKIIEFLKLKGDDFYHDLLKSILFPDPEEINPPPIFSFYLLNSDFVRKSVTHDFSEIMSSIFIEIGTNRQKYLEELEQIKSRMQK
jgi:hypothetical protein